MSACAADQIPIRSGCAGLFLDFSWTSPGRLQGMGVLAKVWPDTYKEWLRRVRSGLYDFGLSDCPPMPLTRYPIRSGCASEMALPTSIYVSMVCRWRPPVWQSAQDTIISSLGRLGPASPASSAQQAKPHFSTLRLTSSLSQRGPSWILRAMHVRGALQLETPVPQSCRKAANLS